MTFGKSGGQVEGFTLVEIIVVVAILAILLALLLPSIESVRRRSLAAASSHNLRQIATANLTYAADNGRYAPMDDYWNNRRWCGARPSPSQPFDPTRGFLSPYLGKSKQITPCPVFTRLLEEQEDKVSSFEEGTGGYGYNDYIGGSIAPNYSRDAQRIRLSLFVTRVPAPARTIMFASTAYARRGGVQEYPFCHPPYWTDELGVPQPFFGRPSPSLHFRFDGKALIAWCDGHLSFESQEERRPGTNPHGGDAKKQLLGWFGPDKDNGYWNPDWDGRVDLPE